MELIEKEGIDMTFIQEPYTAHNRVVGITKRYRTFTSSIGRCRTATVVTNNEINALLIQEATDKDSVVVELILGNLKFYLVNMYLDITEKLDKDIELINGILQLANTSRILITMDSNSRSRMWHDKLTNRRVKKLEKFPLSKQLPIINKKSEMKTFQSSRGSSNMDLTISNNKLLKEIQEWKISEEKSFSDHKTIQFCIWQYNVQESGNNFQGIKYKIRGEDLNKFEASVTQEIAKRMCRSSWKEGNKDLEKYITSQTANRKDMEDILNKFSDTLTLVCNKSFKIVRAFMKTNKHKTVPWWTEDLTIARKRVNAFRRKYQKTKNNNLRDQRQNEYYVEKA